MSYRNNMKTFQLYKYYINKWNFSIKNIFHWNKWTLNIGMNWLCDWIVIVKFWMFQMCDWRMTCLIIILFYLYSSLNIVLKSRTAPEVGLGLKCPWAPNWSIVLQKSIEDFVIGLKCMYSNFHISFIYF